MLRHLDEHDSCDSLYDSLVTAYLEQRVYCEPERAEAAESLAVDVHVRDEAPAEGEEPGPDYRNIIFIPEIVLSYLMSGPGPRTRKRSMGLT